MTSSPGMPAAPSAAESKDSECFVFIHLPEAMKAVICGRFKQQVLPSGVRVGKFTYGQSYRDRRDSVAIDPVGMPLQRGTLPATTDLEGIYGALRDASPDAWGRRVIEYARGAHGGTLPEIDYLLAAGDDRAGALAFGPTKTVPARGKGPHDSMLLQDLMDAADVVQREAAPTPLSERAAQLLLQGVTMGGARPKAVVEHAGASWIAKFPALGDRYNMAAVEAGLLTLAGSLGMRVPRCEVHAVAGRPVLLVQRFDRRGPLAALTRARYLSAMTLLGADEQVSRKWSYLALANELQRRSTQPDADLRELFRRMVFNALVSNQDDHPRNHALLAWEADDWQLSPLFDVVPSGHPSSRIRNLAMIAGAYGRIANRINLVSAATEFRVSTEEADALITTMKAGVAQQWESVFSRCGAQPVDLAAVRHNIRPEGFEDRP